MMRKRWNISWAVSVLGHAAAVLAAVCFGLFGDQAGIAKTPVVIVEMEMRDRPENVSVSAPAPPAAAAGPLAISKPNMLASHPGRTNAVLAPESTTGDNGIPPTADPGAAVLATGGGSGGKGAESPPAGKISPVGVTKAAYVIDGPAPEYPEEARSNRWEGRVEVKMLVSETGAVAEAHVVSSSGYRSLDNAAVRCVRGWRFSPKYVDGRAEATWFVKPVTFRLQ